MFLYRANETMKLLGKQCLYPLVTGNGIAKIDFDNVIKAHKEQPRCTMLDIGVDMFALGYIYGKRAERARRRK